MDSLPLNLRMEFKKIYAPKTEIGIIGLYDTGWH